MRVAKSIENPIYVADQSPVSGELVSSFFAAGFGMVVDQFGIPWMINCAPAA